MSSLKYMKPVSAFSMAVGDMAKSRESFATRLKKSFTQHLSPLNTQELPECVRDDFAIVRKDYGENLTPGAAKELIEKIVSIQHTLSIEYVGAI